MKTMGQRFGSAHLPLHDGTIRNKRAKRKIAAVILTINMGYGFDRFTFGTLEFAKKLNKYKPIRINLVHIYIYYT